MAYQFSDEDKQVREFKDRLPYGVSKVQFVLAEAEETAQGKDYIAVTVANDAGVEEEVRLWFVGGAAPISWNTLRDIAVHNAKTEEAKEAARNAIDSAKDTEELATMLNANTIGGELWFSKYQDPSRTYTGGDGKVRPSINTTIAGYELRERPELLPRAQQSINPNDYPDDNIIEQGKQVPFKSDGDAPGSGIPKGWA